MHAEGVGTYDLSATGSLQANDEFVGPDGDGTFNQSGGTNSVTNSLVLGSLSGPGHGTYNLDDGFLSADTITINNNGTFHMNSGSLSYETFNQTGGIVTGTLENLAGSTFNYDSGTFSGRLVNGGTVNLNADFTAGNGLAQHSATPLTLSAGRAITLNGEGLEVDQGAIFNQDGGNLATTETYIGLAGTGTFNQTGGTNSVTNNLVLGNVDSGQGTYNLEAGTLTAGSIVVNEDSTFRVKDATTTVETGEVWNAGTIETIDATVTWTGTFKNDGIFLSDPSTLTFDDFIVGPDGCVIASQDTFIIKNNFENHCNRNTEWDTSKATLQFITGNNNEHDFFIPGEDLGPGGGANNYAWGALILGETDIEGNIIGPVQTVNLIDGNPGNSGSALYVGFIQGLAFDDPLNPLLITNIFGAGDSNFYYDPFLNPDLDGLVYSLSGEGGGQLTPTPVPGSVLLLGSGLMGLGLLGWRRKRG
jgi:hypothetical protein